MKATIDRIEGAVAVLVSTDDVAVRLNLPAGLLPPGSREGDIVTVTVDADPAGTREARNRIAEKIRHLRGPE